MYLFNPYPSYYQIEPLNLDRLLPLLELIWEGNTFDILYGIPLIDGIEVSMEEAEKYASASSHLLEAPITKLESLSPVIKKISNGGHASQTIFHFDLNKQCSIGQSFNKSFSPNSTRLSKYFGCNAKQKKHAIQKFWRKCKFPTPDRWSKLPLKQVSTKFLTGHLKTYQSTRELKFVNETVEPVYLTHWQIMQALPAVLKTKNGYTGAKQIAHRNNTKPTGFLPVYTTYHIHRNISEEELKSYPQDYSTAYRNKCIPHLTSRVKSTKYDIYDRYEEFDGVPF